MPTEEISSFEFAFLLEGFQSEDPARSTRFDKVARPLLFRLAKRHNWGLSEDQLEEVVQEAFLCLLRKGVVRFNPQRGDVAQYLLGRLLNAVKTVRAQYGLKRAAGVGVSVELERVENALLSKSVVSIEAINSRQVARRILLNLEPALKEACYRVLADHEPKTVVAADLRLNRFALARRIRAVKVFALQFANCA